jgi:hypothetical protein
MRNGMVLALVLFLIAITIVNGQKPPITPAARKEILDYPLTLTRADHIISVLPLMTQFFMSQPQDVITKWTAMTPALKIAALGKSPEAMAILKPYDLTARDYVVGVPALRMALWRAQGVAETPGIFASPGNLAFAKAHLSQLKPKWEAVDGPPQPDK